MSFSILYAARDAAAPFRVLSVIFSLCGALAILYALFLAVYFLFRKSYRSLRRLERQTERPPAGKIGAPSPVSPETAGNPAPTTTPDGGSAKADRQDARDVMPKGTPENADGAESAGNSGERVNRPGK